MQLTHPRTLGEALELAVESETVTCASRQSVPSSLPIVVTVGRLEPAWVDELVRAVSLQGTAGRWARNGVCWGCGKPGQLIRHCPATRDQQGNGRGSISPGLPTLRSQKMRSPSGGDQDINTHCHAEPVVIVGWTEVSNRCHVPVMVGNVPSPTLVDTGSTATLLRPDIVPTGTVLEPTSVKLRTVTGETAAMKGRGLCYYTGGFFSFFYCMGG